MTRIAPRNVRDPLSVVPQTRVLDFRRDLNKKTKESIERRCTELWEQRRGAKAGNPLIKVRRTRGHEEGYPRICP